MPPSTRSHAGKAKVPATGGWNILPHGLGELPNPGNAVPRTAGTPASKADQNTPPVSVPTAPTSPRRDSIGVFRSMTPPHIKAGEIPPTSSSTASSVPHYDTGRLSAAISTHLTAASSKTTKTPGVASRKRTLISSDVNQADIAQTDADHPDPGHLDLLVDLTPVRWEEDSGDGQDVPQTKRAKLTPATHSDRGLSDAGRQGQLDDIDLLSQDGPHQGSPGPATRANAGNEGEDTDVEPYQQEAPQPRRSKRVATKKNYYSGLQGYSEGCIPNKPKGSDGHKEGHSLEKKKPKPRPRKKNADKGEVKPKSTGKGEVKQKNGDEVQGKQKNADKAQEKPKKIKGAKDYRLTPGITPYPDYMAPTHEQAGEVFNILADLHQYEGMRIRHPEEIPDPSLEVTGCGEVPSVLDALCRTILSATVKFDGADKMLKALVKKYGTLEHGVGKGSVNWEKVRLAPLEEVSATIKVGGMQNLKATQIKGLLDVVYEDNKKKLEGRQQHGKNNAGIHRGQSSFPTQTPSNNGATASVSLRANPDLGSDEDLLSLNHMFKMDHDQAMDYFLQFDGVAIKTASCVILFCLQIPSYAVDTHVARFSNWLGWVPQGPNGKEVGPDNVFKHCQVRVPDRLKYGLHQLFIRHGQTCHRCKQQTRPGSKLWNETECPLEALLNRKKTARKVAGKKVAWKVAVQKAKEEGADDEVDEEPAADEGDEEQVDDVGDEKPSVDDVDDDPE